MLFFIINSSLTDCAPPNALVNFVEKLGLLNLMFQKVCWTWFTLKHYAGRLCVHIGQTHLLDNI